MTPKSVTDIIGGERPVIKTLDASPSHLIAREQSQRLIRLDVRARFKIYLADAAIAPVAMRNGKAILEDAAALGLATETAVFKHLLPATARRPCASLTGVAKKTGKWLSSPKWAASCFPSK